MTSKSAVDAFVRAKTLAVVGVSRTGTKFGNTIMRELSQKGYTVYPVNPQVDEIEGVRCYRTVGDLPKGVEGAIVVVSPDKSEEVVRDVAAAGIPRVWLQQGAESPGALSAAEELGIEVVSKNCILMFAEPVESIHKFHRFFKRVFGRMPA